MLTCWLKYVWLFGFWLLPLLLARFWPYPLACCFAYEHN